MSRQNMVAIVCVLILMNLTGFVLLRHNRDSQTIIPTLAVLPVASDSVPPHPTEFVQASQTENANTENQPFGRVETAHESDEIEVVNNLHLSLTIQPTDQIVVRFSTNATPDEKQAYLNSIGATVISEIAPLNTVVIRYENNPPAIPALPLSPVVMVNEPDYFAGALVDISVPTSDTYFAEQWGLTYLNVPSAWAQLPVDAPQVVVAVIDSGICFNHPDLSGRILNTGYDYVENDTMPQDEFGHGCGVAGIIAANIDNGIGVAGIAPNAQILPLRVLDSSGIGRYSDVAAAIIRAVDAGGEVINLSLGGQYPSSVLEDAINYAVARDVIVVAAAGNTGGATPLYPAAYEPVIAVGSVNQNGTVSRFSNRDADTYAPGEQIITLANSGGYTTVSGTSFAAPIVTGSILLDIPIEQFLLTGGEVPNIDPLGSFETLSRAMEDAIVSRTGNSLTSQIIISEIENTEGWIFGITGVPAPSDEETPSSYLYIAKEINERYTVALEGTPEFVRFLQEAPANFINPQIRSTFDVYAQGNGSSELSLPWATGETWILTSGLHPDGFADDNNSPSNVWSAIDFGGGSGQVRAASGGVAYVPCSNWVRIDHSNGWRTSYYHLINIRVSNGQLGITRGQHLGDISDQHNCGGDADGPHVHFALWRNGIHQSLNNIDIGGWTVQSNGVLRQGCMQRISDSVIRCVNQAIYNDGSIGSGILGTPPPDTDIIQNGLFDDGMTNWSKSGLVEASVQDGELRIRATGSPAGTVGQLMNYTAPKSAPFQIALTIGNTSSINRTIRVILDSPGVADIGIVCEFVVPPNTTPDLYVIRGKDNDYDWSQINLRLQPRDTDELGGLIVSSASLQYRPSVTLNTRVTCLQPNQTVTRNASFDNGINLWTPYYQPQYAISDFTSNGAFYDNVLAWSRPSGSTGAVFYQDLLHLMPRKPVEIYVDLGNIGNTTRTVVVTLFKPGSTDPRLSCSFHVPPIAVNNPENMPLLQTYVLRGWITAGMREQPRFEMYLPASQVAPSILTDNIRVVYRPDLAGGQLPVDVTECMYPAPVNGELIRNGDFSSNLSEWSFNTNSYRAVEGSDSVLHFYGINGGNATMWQLINYNMGPLPIDNPTPAPIETRIELGNSSNVSRLVKIAFHNPRVNKQPQDTLFCDFSIPPNTPLQLYIMRGLIHETWSNPAFQIWHISNDNIGDVLIDNISVAYRHDIVPTGTECITTGSITGTVYDSDGVTPLSHIPVRIDGWSEFVCTDANGHYMLSGLPTGEVYTLSAGGDASGCGGSQVMQTWWMNAASQATATAINMPATGGISNINITILFSCDSVTSVSVTECNTLLEFYNSTTGDNWIDNSNWLQNQDVCSWYGVECTANTITSINLNNNNLVGALNPSIANLTQLESLQLAQNSLGGTLQTQIGSLTNLTQLSLSSNQFTGNIPVQLMSLTNLSQFDLANNQLTGSIPISISNLAALQQLRLDTNHLTGVIPTELTMLTNLQVLTLNGNQFSGEVPPTIGNLVNLHTLTLQNNQLKGHVPASFVDLTNLATLDVGYNMLTAADSTVDSFLDSRDEDWNMTQNVVPSDVGTLAIGLNDATLSWTPVPYSSDGGYYIISRSGRPGFGPYTPILQTVDKTISTATVDNMQINTAYEFCIQTFTPAHGSQQNSLTSDCVYITITTITPTPTQTLTPTSTPPPVSQTVGLFSNSYWAFRDSNTTGSGDVRFQFGTTEAGWVPIIGDWNGDNVDGIGLYRNGSFLLRDTSNAGVIDYVVTIGVSDSGWQPIAGDWDGDGQTTVGLYKNGLWLLTNQLQRNAAIAHRVNFNPFGTYPARVIAGDWNGDGLDTIGLYYNGSFRLLNHLSATTVTNFIFGPIEAGWIALAGDWNADGIDTIGVFKDGIWRLRNSNSSGTPDIGFTFRGNGLPVASYRGGVAPLLALSQAANITLDVSIEPTVAATTEPTQPPVVEITPEATVEVTEITATTEVEITPEATAEVTVMPTETPVPPEPTIEPTVIPIETPLPEATDIQPEATQEASAP